MSIKISLQNEGGEIDCRVVETEEQAREAVIDIVGGIANLCAGDKIIISEIEE